MTDYLRLAHQNVLPQQQDDAEDNPYLSIAREQQALQQRRARTIIETALKDDPELAAERQRLSQTSGLPLRVIERNLEEVRIKERAKAIDLVRMASESPVLYRQLTDPTFTTTAIDDLGTLEKIERAVGKTAAFVMGADGSGGLPAAAKTVGLGATVGVGKMIFDVAGVVNDLIGWDSGAASARGAAKRMQTYMDENGFQPESSTGQAVKSGLQSAGTNLALLPIGLYRGLYATANQAASTVAGLMSAGVGADAFNRAREQGRSELQAGIYAIPEAAFEFVFERIPASKLFGDIAADETLLRMLGKQMFSEGWTEQVTTLAQDFNEWMNLNQDKPLADYIAERPEAAYQTFVATLVGVGVQTSTIKSIDKIIEKASQQKLQFELDQFNEQLALASQSMLRQRSPEQFRALVQRIVDENTDAKKEIYVDGQVLNQLPADVLAQLPEAVREQIPEAAATNSVVAIPMADVLTVAPGTPLEQILNDNARMTPESLSRVEAQQASEQAQEFLKQEAERVLAQAADQAAWQHSANTVKQKILDQLNQAGRFTSDVNEAYATLQANFFSSMAARVGLTPQELYERYQLKVAAKSPGGEAYNASRGLTVEGYHYSRAPRPVVSTAAFGTGLVGSNRDLYLNAEDRRLRKRAYFYVDKGTGINPEAGVGGIAHKATLTNIYDADADPLRLKKGDQLAFESAVLDAGFSGYLTRMEGTQSGQVIMLGEQEIPTEVIGPATQLRGQVVPPPQARESKGRDVIVDALNANKSLPIGAPTRQRWSALLEAMMPEAHAALKAAGVFDGNPDDNLYKSDLIREFEAATEAPVYGQAAIERLTPVAERGERVTGSRAVITPEEKQAIKESAEKVGVSEREITSVVRKHKLAHPPAQGWAPLVFNRAVVEDGKVIYEYRKTPYDFNTDKEGKALTPGTPEYRRRVNAMARGMAEEVRRVLRRAQAGDKNAQNILAQASWYKAMRRRLRQEFGGLGDLFADLLGATSPNTPVRDNWANAVDALRRASRGDFDALMPQWEAWADRIDELELDFRAWFNERLAEGLTKKAIKALPEYKAKLDALKEARKLPDNLLPTKEGGKKYGFNGRNVVRALVDLWRVVKNADSDIARGGTAPKALNFSGNLIGFRERATIDVWAARMLQRLAGGLRIPSMAETAVSGEMREDGTTTLQFGFGQDVFSEAVKRIRADEELKADKTLADINDDDLQAVVWFVEKELWTVNNWTNAAGEGGSFEIEANLTGSAEQDRIKELRRILDSSKSTPQAKAQAREQLAALERTVDRFVGGLSIQMSADTQGVDYVPTDADMARLANKVRTAIYEADDGNTVLGSKALSTEGRYGGVERSLDLEVVAREGYNANGLWLEMLRQAQAARQDSTFLSRVLRPDEQPDPLRHRPGVEIYFRDAAATEQLEEVLAELRQQGVEFFTVIVDGRRLSEAVAGAMPPAVGVRLQYVPEFEQRYGMDDLSGLDDVALADKIKQKADELDRLAARVSASVDGVSFAGQFWYDTQVAFSAEYQEKIDALTARTAEGEAAQAGGGVWVGQSIRAGIESANRQLRETSGGESGGDVLGGDAPVQTGDRGGGGYSGGTLAPLEGAPVVEGATGPDPRLVAVAEQYARDNGIDLKRQAVYVDVDPERARRIAAAYEAMPHAPQDPAVKEAYENLIRQTIAQYRALEAAGYRFYFYDETNDPYAGNPWNAMRDLRANQVMGVFATEAGFGSGATELNVEDNPLLADTGITWPYGSLDGEPKRVLANDLFRAVHDAFGHGLEGAGFRARGEENAWQAHVRLFTGSAVAALTSETRGQNSWLNYGPYGERNRNAKVEDTIFADQKTGLMPEWTWTEGRAPDADEGVFNQAAPTGRPNYQTTYTDPQGETYEIRLTQEVFGVGDGRELTVQVGAFQNGQRRARVDFELQGNTLAAGNTVVAPAYRRRGLAEAMYRAAREAGYDIMPGRKQTADGERLVARLREKGVINRERPLEQGVALRLPETIDVDGVQRPTRNSNGQPIHPTEEGIRNFWRWFGDSKAVDFVNADTGAPVVSSKEPARAVPKIVYHTTLADFEAFEVGRSTVNSGTFGSWETERHAIFVTPDINSSQAYGTRGGVFADGANVMPLYIKAENPLDLTEGVSEEAFSKLEQAGMSPRYILNTLGHWEMFDGDEGRDVVEMIKAAGYDSVIFNDENPDTGESFESWAVFHPEQIKSATGNRGTFDPNSPNILSQGPRGTFDPKQLLITLNENADLSTFLHESGHFFLEVLADLASQPNAPQQIVDDMATILKWFGIKGDEQVGGSDSGAPLAQQDAEAVSEAIYKEMAADDELVAALEAWMVDGTQPDAATNEKLLGYMRRMPPVPRDSYLTFYRGQPRGVAPHSRGWASWTTNPDTTRFFTEGDSEVLQRKGVQGISLEQIALWRTRLTGELTDYGSQGEWLVLNESVFAQGGDLPTDTTKPAGRTPLEVWNAMTLDQKRLYHERWAEAFEQYLFEGKAPSQELQPLFRRFRSWLINVYKSLKQFMLGRNLQLGDDIRKVFDRLIATDEEIAQAEEAAGMLPDFDATNEAIEKLQARSLRDLKWAVNARNKTIKALQKQAAKLRKEVEAEVRAEVEQLPVYRAIRWLKKGETVDPETGDLVKAEKGFRLNTDALAEMYPETMLARPDLTRLRGMTAKNGLHPDMVADMFGFGSGDALVRAIIDAQPINEVIEGMTDQRMLERHGDLATPEAIEEAANEAVHNEARARALATELKAQTEMLNPRQATGRTASNGRPITVNAITEAAKQFAQNLAARRRVKDLRNAAHQHRAAEARAAKRWQQATAKGDTQAAVQAKRDQLLNNYAAKALQDAQAEAKKILEFFRRVARGNNEKIVERGRDPDVVNAMRAILAAYGVAPRLEKSALEYMEVVAKNDPAMYAALKPSVDAALFNAKPLDELTMEELRGLNDELRAMWDLAKRSRQMEVDGNLLDIEEAADQLVARMQEIGVPDTVPGERAAITDREEAGIKLQFAKAILSRVEQWAERMDGKFGGPFLRLVFQPIKEAADAYRTARVDYRKRFTALLENIAPILRPGAIPAPELGYTFGNARDSGQAELLHAILHTGNESNKRKLLLGRGWATELEDGTLDTSRWDAFIARMINEGKITKAHYDFAQGVWDLLEEMKPLAQETHRKVFGRYFAEVTATPFDTPFGSYRGGYVPAQTDPRMVKDAKLRELAEAENESMAYAFPASPSGFTKARVEYNKPLLLDLRALAQHIDKVLLFSYMQGPVTDVRRLLTNKRVSYALDRIDPGAYEGMLIPWLNRAAKQIVETPVVGDRKLSRFLSAARNRAGMALMFANLSNTVQQITGFSLAAVKVKPSLMMKATASFIADPKAMKERVATASEYMRNRMLNEVAAMNDAVEQILVNATKLEKAKDWTQRHAYFLQVAVDNTMSPIIWTAAYNQAIEQKMSHKDAVRFADGVIRQTQGTTLPEDISRFESGPAYLRLFTQFASYFNMMANTNATAMKQIVDEMGLRKGAGRLLYVALAGLLVPIWVAEAIALAFRGGPEDEDDDGYLDDWLMAVFGLGTLRGMVAQVPIVGQAAQLAVNRFNDNPADDKFSLSPAVSLLESAVSSPASVYKAIVDEGSAQKAVRDVAAAATLITGLPIYAAARPIGYLAGMADERIEPTGPVDLARGLVTGTASPESKVP